MTLNRRHQRLDRQPSAPSQPQPDRADAGQSGLRGLPRRARGLIRRKALLAVGVLLAGVAVACWVGMGFLGMKPGHNEFGLTLALMAAFFGGLPALLVLLPTRVALAGLIGIAALLGLWGVSVLRLPHGGIGGVILLFADVVFLLFGLSVIGLRFAIIKNPAE